LQSLLGSGTFGTVADREATAILFAQRFADTLRHPTLAARLALAKQFTPYQRLEIMAWIHFIYFTNLSGNSADAWLGRFRGWKVVDGHPFPEALAGLVAAPVLFIGWLRSLPRVSPLLLQAHAHVAALGIFQRQQIGERGQGSHSLHLFQERHLRHADCIDPVCLQKHCHY
jgi:hypothetical protein